MPSQFKRYLVVAGIFALANSSDMFLLLRAREAGVSLEQIPLLWAGISLITTVFGTPLSALSDTFGRKRFILIAWIAFAVFYIAMGLPGISTHQIFALFVVYGLFKAATEGVEKALVADMAPKGFAGTAFGWIYESIAPLYAFLFSGGCALLAFILMAFWVFRDSSIEFSKSKSPGGS
jgi:MFS family permease